MRISTQQMQTNGVNLILEQQSELSYTQQQLATGKRILNPSDDISGSTQALALKKVIATHEQYVRNIGVVESRLVQEETVISQAVDSLQRIHELAIQSTGPLIGASEKQHISVEVREILGQLLSLANSEDTNGEYLFAGHNVDTAPFTATENPVGSGQFDYAYTGDSGQRFLQIGTTLQVAVSDPGDDVFMDVPISAGGTQSIFETIEQFALDLESNTPNVAIIDDALLAIEHLGLYQSLSGARQNVVADRKSFNADVILQSETTLSSIQDLDYAEAVSRMNLQLVSLEAAQQSFSRIQNLSLFNYL